MDNIPLLELHQIKKRFENLSVLAGANAALNRSELLLLLGENGAGKTTFLKIAAGILGFDEGQRLCRASTLYLGAAPQCFGHFTVKENAKFWFEISGESNYSEEILQAELRFWDLTKIAHRLCGSLSRGLMQRLALCQAFLRLPQILILDEPSSGLDSKGQKLLVERLKLFLQHGERSVMVASHEQALFMPLCSRTLTIMNGSII